MASTMTSSIVASRIASLARGSSRTPAKARATTPRRFARIVVRAEQAPIEEKLEEAVNNTSEAVSNTTETVQKAAETPVQPATAPSFGDAMAFSGPAPEVINGRLAMLAFVAAAGAELATGAPVAAQLKEAPLFIGLTFLIFSIASLVPILKGAKLNKSVGPFNPTAELLNGRAAMLGFALLLSLEWAKGGALL